MQYRFAANFETLNTCFIFLHFFVILDLELKFIEDGPDMKLAGSDRISAGYRMLGWISGRPKSDTEFDNRPYIGQSGQNPTAYWTSNMIFFPQTYPTLYIQSAVYLDGRMGKFRSILIPDIRFPRVLDPDEVVKISNLDSTLEKQPGFDLTWTYLITMNLFF